MSLLRLSRTSQIGTTFSLFAPFDGETYFVNCCSSQRPTKIRTLAIVVSGPKKRTKKGPKRVKKSFAQLDQEMEDYRASATDKKMA